MTDPLLPTMAPSGCPGTAASNMSGSRRGAYVWGQQKCVRIGSASKMIGVSRGALPVDFNPCKLLGAVGVSEVCLGAAEVRMFGVSRGALVWG